MNKILKSLLNTFLSYSGIKYQLMHLMHISCTLRVYFVFTGGSRQTDRSVLGETEAAVSPCRAHGATETGADVH